MSLRIVSYIPCSRYALANDLDGIGIGREVVDCPGGPRHDAGPPASQQRQQALVMGRDQQSQDPLSAFIHAHNTRHTHTYLGGHTS